ncbi:MAG: cell division protein FtsA [Chitinophagia bacterium]|nr:cell division protein FtsA [Chitinophagia bacterium]
MKKENPIFAGLDIGTTKIALVVGRKDAHGKFEILAFGKSKSEGVANGEIINIEHCTRAIREALQNCLASNPNLLSIKDVYVGVAGRHIKSMQLRGEIVRPNKSTLISQEDIDLLIENQKNAYNHAGEKIIEIIPQVFTVDNYHTTPDPIGMLGTKIAANFHVVTAKEDEILKIEMCVRAAGLRIVDMVLQPLASAMAVLNGDDLELGVGVVDIGGGTTDMAIFTENTIMHTAVIPLAGNIITTDIQRIIGIMQTQAEMLKVKFGSALPSEASNEIVKIPAPKDLVPREISQVNLSKIINARLDEIFQCVRYNLNVVDAQKNLAAGIVLTGGGSALAHIKQLASVVTLHQTRLGKPNQHISTQKDGKFNEVAESPMYATVIGLLLRANFDYEKSLEHDTYNELELGGKKVVNKRQHDWKAAENYIKKDIVVDDTNVEPTPPIPQPVAEDPTPEPNVEADNESNNKPVKESAFHQFWGLLKGKIYDIVKNNGNDDVF